MAAVPETSVLSPKQYEKELLRLQTELVYMQEWIVARGQRLVVVFEGRDTAGKDGVIKRITAFLNPRTCRVVAVPTPTERERTQWYFQRYVEHLPSAGEIVLFDRSWYNRAGVEHVMGFCSEEQYEEFLRFCPEFEQALLNDGITLVKYWLSVSDEEQERRFEKRLTDPRKRWKFSTDRPAGACALGRLRRGEGPDVRLHRHAHEPVVRRRGRRQALGATEPDRPPALARSLRAPRRRAARRAAAAPAAQVPAPGEGHRAARARALLGRELSAAPVPRQSALG